MNNIFEGILRSISGTSYYLDDGSGRDWVLIEFDAEHDTPINVNIALSVYVDFHGNIRCSPVGKYYDLT